MSRSEILRRQTIECSPLRGHSLNQYKIKKALEGEIRADGLRGKIGRIIRRQAREAQALMSRDGSLDVRPGNQVGELLFNVGGSFRRKRI